MSTNPVSMLVVGLILCLIGGLGAGLIKTVGGSVTVSRTTWETPEGHRQAGQLFVPENATADTPAPAVVIAHGGSLNSEYPAQHYIELARRGYVVHSIDMYGHGNSDTVDDESAYRGLYDGVQYVAALPHVDRAGIGITGNSNGAFAVSEAVALDDEAERPLISSALYVVNDPVMVEGQAIASFIPESNRDYVDIYGGRDVGVAAAQYDVTFHRVVLEDGTVSAPRDFLHQDVAQSFLHFGRNPAGLEFRDSHTLHREDVGGEEVIRVLYDRPILHPWSLLSPGVAGDGIEFFQASLPAPDPLGPDDQIWLWKTFFSAIGIAGLFVFMTGVVLAVLRTRGFGTLRADGPVTPRAVDRRGRIWLWGGLSATAVFAMGTFVPVFWIASALAPGFFRQTASFALASWSLLVALFTFLVLFLNYRRYARDRGLDLREQGVVLTNGATWRTLALGVFAPVCMYVVVLLVHHLFGTGLHVWTILNFHAFGADTALEAVKYLPFFLAFSVALSIATNVFNHVRISGREWIDVAVLAFFNTLGAILLLVLALGYFVATGNTPLDSVGFAVFTPLNVVINVLAIVPIATVLSRVVYRATRNPYLPAVAMGIVATVMTASTALTAA
ncbi:hypothetical protein WIS52_11795 [Pseudonocardia nematodicida]|uniref:Alpha/beta hydrolase n=1 Tax=Pseudonocardia nematodicida TaxID=1206997 RepID=A0ABV1KA87_9PSEU